MSGKFVFTLDEPAAEKIASDIRSHHMQPIQVRHVLLLRPLLLVFACSLFLQAQDLVRHAIKVTAADGIHLTGNYYAPAKGGGPGVLMFHQCSRDRMVWDPLATTLA